MMRLRAFHACETSVGHLPHARLARRRSRIVAPTFKATGKADRFAREGRKRPGEVLAHEQFAAHGQESLRKIIGMRDRSDQKESESDEFHQAPIRRLSVHFFNSSRSRFCQSGCCFLYS